jgi:hypothetical protein
LIGFCVVLLRIGLIQVLRPFTASFFWGGTLFEAKVSAVEGVDADDSFGGF